MSHSAIEGQAAKQLTAFSAERSYQPGLDGIRAVAVTAVLLFHGGIEWLPGGFLGVDVFFVLSGYLITGLLIREQASTQQIRLKAFYQRRARRLLPALIVMLLVSMTCAAFFMQDVIKSTVQDFPFALSGLSNWWFVLHHQSYFEAMGRPPLFQHTWSLAVEAQFYLVWPFLILWLFPAVGVTGIRRVALACSIASAGALMLVSSPGAAGNGAATSHAYFGSDTHSMGLFLGAALATLQWSFRSPDQSGGRPLRLTLDSVGVLAIAALVFLFYAVDESVGRYRLGLPAASICSAILIAVTTFPGSALSRWLGLKPLTWIGERSYSIYVWHWPIFQATRGGIDVSVSGLPNLCLRLALTLLIAEVSYRYVEMPVRKGALVRWRTISSHWTPRTYRAICAATVAVVLFAVAGEIGLVYKAWQAESKPVAVIPVDPVVLARGSSNSSHPVAKSKGLGTQDVAATQTFKPGVRPTIDGSAIKVESPDVQKLPVMLLGDSVLLGVSQWIERQLNVVKVDAVVGRQAIELQRLISELAEAGELQPVVILNLGNNGVVEEATLRAILTDLRGCQRVVVVNTRVPRRWQDADDALMARVVPEYPNAVLADWRAASEGHPEYFGPDGVHAGTLGAKAYAELVISALALPPLSRP